MFEKDHKGGRESPYLLAKITVSAERKPQSILQVGEVVGSNVQVCRLLVSLPQERRRCKEATRSEPSYSRVSPGLRGSLTETRTRRGSGPAEELEGGLLWANWRLIGSLLH